MLVTNQGVYCRQLWFLEILVVEVEILDPGPGNFRGGSRVSPPLKLRGIECA